MEDKKIFRLTDEDFLMVMEDLGITDEKEIKYILERAHNSFNIENWYEIVKIFVEEVKYELEIRQGK